VAESAATPNGAGAVRDVYAGGAARRWELVHRASLAPDAEIEPETIVEQEDATIVVPAGWRGRVGAGATLVLDREDA
jgi:N-methylhydantoinase A/oxoprolinase/acetone carboxylase beta subunit